MKKVIITGANGYLGHELSAYLGNTMKIHKIFGPEINAQDQTGASINLLDFKSLKKYIKSIKPETVFHAAAMVNLNRGYETAKQVLEVNIEGTLNLLEACIQAEVKKFIFVSSQDVYGDNKIPYTEDMKPNPPSPYSISKLAGEELCKLYSVNHGIKYSIVRMSTIYGPGQIENKFIPSIIKNALHDEMIKLNSGKKKRDYLFLHDALDFYKKLINKDIDTNEIINLGGGHAHKLDSLVKMIIESANSKSSVKLNAFPDRIGEADIMLSDIKKAKDLLGWEPRVGLQEGLYKTIQIYKEKL